MRKNVYPIIRPACFEARETDDRLAGIRAEELPPREKMLAAGVGALTDQELVAVLLGSGTKSKPVAVLSADLLDRLDRSKDIPKAEDLSVLEGIGMAKACAVTAALELGRRRWGTCGAKVLHPSDIYSLVRHNADRKQEHFIVLTMNGAHEVLMIRTVTVGLVNRTIVHPREVYADAILDRAAAVAVAHNHPSGQMKPSQDDDTITKRLFDAAAILGLNFMDHLIFSENSWYSYRMSGRLGDGQNY